MLHKVTIPELTFDRLSRLVRIQMELIHYAASQPNGEFNEEEDCKMKCVDHLNIHFPGCGEAIANWVWKKDVNGIGYLTNFSAETDSCNDSKSVWAKKLYDETENWLKAAEQKQRPQGELSTHENQLKPRRSVGAKSKDETDSDNKDGGTKYIPWKDAAANFLRNFYQELGGKGLPGDFFKTADGASPSSFSRQDILREFLKVNSGLQVCAICDASSFVTLIYEKEGKDSDEGNGASERRTHIHTQLDHFLPESLYPHLACHPCNLIPICSACNSAIKWKTDPLNNPADGTRFKLDEITCPYSSGGLVSQISLEVIKKSIVIGDSTADSPVIAASLTPGPKQETTPKNSLMEIRGLKGRDADKAELREAVAILERVYRLPERWQTVSTEIEITLFRRIRYFFRGIDTHDLKDSLRNSLKYLLFYLQDVERGDSGRDPLSFAMTWYLAALINDEIPEDDSGSALIEELVSWYKKDAEDAEKRAETVTEILKLVQSQRKSGS